MRFLLTPHGSDLYKQSRQLRTAVLRLPLRMILSAADIFGEEKQLHFVAVENDLVVGTVTMKPLSPTRMKLRQMAVSDAMQGKKVGRKLVLFAESAIKAYGVETVETHARTAAQGFYEKLGYVAEGEPFIERTLPNILMTKTL